MERDMKIDNSEGTVSEEEGSDDESKESESEQEIVHKKKQKLDNDVNVDKQDKANPQQCTDEKEIMYQPSKPLTATKIGPASSSNLNQFKVPHDEGKRSTRKSGVSELVQESASSIDNYSMIANMNRPAV